MITEPLLFSSTSPDFVALGAIVCSEDPGSSRHTTNPGDFENIRSEVPSSFLENPKWYHVFVTNDESKAEKLRSQKRKDLPGDIIIRSAVCDVNWLGSIHGRLVGMSKKRVCRHRLLAISSYRNNSQGT